jgi:gamma-glutamylputrescine oxidase
VATALALAECGRSVILLEARRIGWGASGRNGGFVSPGYSISMLALAERLGRDSALALWRLSTDAVALVRQHATKLGCGILSGSGVIVCRMAEQPDTLSLYLAAMNERYNAGLLPLSAADLRKILITDRYADGILDPHSFLVHPLKLVRGMAKEATRRGALVHEGSPVRKVNSSGASKLITTEHGSVRSHHVVLSGGAYIGCLNRRLGLSIVPVSSSIMVTKPEDEQIRALIRTEAGIFDNRVIPDYYRILPDGRLLWGGRATGFQPKSERIGRLLQRDMTRTYPQLSHLAVDSIWAGWMPFAKHQMPIIAQIGPGIWAASGFGGQGLATTTVAGTLIASAIADGDDRYRYFAAFGASFAGGPLIGRTVFQVLSLCHRFSTTSKAAS